MIAVSWVAPECVRLVDENVLNDIRIGHDQDVGHPGPEMSDGLIVGGAGNRLDIVAHQRAQTQQAERAFRRLKRNEIGIGIHARYRTGSRLRGNKAYVLLCPLLVRGGRPFKFA